MAGKIDRRNFLKISTAATGGLLISFVIPAPAESPTPAIAPANKFRLHPFLRIGEDNSIHISIPKVEIGQGIWTTLPMLIAEELDCDWNKIIVEHSPPGTATDYSEPILKSTGGSETTKSEFDNYRLVGATARTMLVNAAVQKFGVKASDCKTENGFVIIGEKRVPYGDLANEASLLPVPTVQLREAKDWKIIGRSKKRLDAREKLDGSAKYGIDVQFPGLLTAVVAHAPVFGGQVASFDASKAKLIKGVKQVLQIPTGIAVIADNFWAAKKGRDALIIQWKHGVHENIDTKSQLNEYRKLSTTKGIPIVQKGDCIAALKNAAKSINAEFTFPYLAHAPMEPLNCTVRISQDKCEIWAGTQSQLLHQLEVAAFLGLKPEQVEFNTPYIGGSFGRRGSFSLDWVMEAVNIAKISGQLIKLIWTREDDIQGGYYRPVYLHRVQIGVDKAGFPVAWQHTIVGQSLFVNSPLEKYIVHNGIDYSSVTTGYPYADAIPDKSFELVTTTNGVPVLAWRSVGHTHGAFVIETLIDELAALANVDPVEYRRRLLKDHPRHLAALNLAAAKAEWHKPLPQGRYRGVAVHEAMGSYVAQIAEISIENKNIRVHRVVCAIDCGVAVNPDGVIAQMEGGIVFGLTAALYGEITLEKGRVQQSNFHNYRMLRMNETPAIEVHIVPSTGKMGGAGEPGVPPIAPALANAIFAATGQRLRDLPLRLK
ncbi:xanthine dehydrogenase family protein molybdopterin-binding subunit [Niastella caeni]|uniref:Xanthine dehydrogenase family protein molybdopterin-binding subunit n=1 Tax=Niastella caeni TaxID=2569763 RepID=A0A4V6T3M0_9BACT|nr:xanthine dehydrogenase family protein molybdopterin-binding subunit [Niastella caeni]THU32976.1 xanthine dehydrogenase family protein molybdopterin-binding subunit [Niastella caeni]